MLAESWEPDGKLARLRREMHGRSAGILLQVTYCIRLSAHGGAFCPGSTPVHHTRCERREPAPRPRRGPPTSFRSSHIQEDHHAEALQSWMLAMLVAAP